MPMPNPEPLGTPPIVTKGSALRPVNGGSATLPMQPEPIEYNIARHTIGLVTMSAVERLWASRGDAERCHHCPASECVITPRNTCVKLYPGFVDVESLRLRTLPRPLGGDGFAGLRVEAGPDHS